MEGGQVGGGEGGIPPTVLAHPDQACRHSHVQEADEDDSAPALNPSDEAVTDRVGSEEEEAGQELEQASHPARHLHPLVDGAQPQGHMGARAR